MDIYRFIDSRDMREHLQKLNYPFTPPEAAFLVYRCKAATLEEMRLQEQQQANALDMEQNDLLNRQNSIAEKVRRDANIAAAVGTVQRHNTNMAIKKMDREISSGGRYITCRRMRFIGAGRKCGHCTISCRGI